MDQYSFTVQFLKETFPAFYLTEKKIALLALKKLQAKEVSVLFGIDTETMALPKYTAISKAALSPHLSKIRLLQVFDGRSVVVFDLLKIGDNSIFKEFLESKRFIAHNAVFDLMFFMKMGIKNMNIGCTMILAKILFHATYPTDEGLSVSLQNLIQMIFKCEVGKENQASDWGVEDLISEQIEYAALDAVYVLKLAEKLAPGLTKFKLEKSYKLLKDAQHPIASLQLNGIKLDADRHRNTVNVWRDKLYSSKKEVLEMTKLEKITSHTIADYLLQTLPDEVLNIWPLTETCKLSTDSNTFSDFSYLPIVKPFSDFQRREKLTSSFGMRLISNLNPETGRLHPRFNLTGARTGRLSCSAPNCQQIPRSPDKRKYPDEPDIRENFVPEKGCVFVCADYGQIELRVASELSQDKEMLHAYKNGIDLHALTASQIGNISLDRVTKEDRQKAKALNFGLLFGLGAGKLSHYARKSYGVEITPTEAFETVRAWHELYEGYTLWQQIQVKEGARTLHSRTPYGKLRRLPPDNCYGTAMNTPVQGGAAEVILSALIRLDNTLKEFYQGAKIINVVHDEIIIECAIELTEFVKIDLEKCMIDGFLDVFPKGVIKNLVEAKVGNSWASAK